MFFEWIGMTPGQLAYVWLCILLAGMARGFSGFGFTLLSVMSLSFVLPLTSIVPAMFVLEIAAGLKLLPELWGKVHWPSIRVLVISSVVATPLGAWLLASLPATAIKLLLGVIVLLIGIALLSGFRMQRMPSVGQTTATGVSAGILNGSLGLGGPPVIVFFLSSPLALEAGRASIIAAFLAMDFAALPALWALDMFGRPALMLGLVALPALLVGVWCGSRMSKRVDEVRARKLIVYLLLLMAAGTFAELLLGH